MGPPCGVAASAAACIAVLTACPCAAAPDIPPCAHVDQGYEDPAYVGTDSDHSESAVSCHQQCQDDPKCEFFTWYIDTNACWLFPKGMALETLPGAIGGPKACTTTAAVATTSASSQFVVPTAPLLSAAACLLWYGNGCSKITNKDLCLSSRDGRPFQDLKGRLTGGQPCVWCGGGRCGVKRESGLEDTSLCQPYDWVKEAFQQPTNFTVATCEFGKLLPQQTLRMPEQNPRVAFQKIGRACRGDTITDAGRKNNNYYWVWTANTLRQCMAFCTQKEMCTGIEYNAANSYCEVWWKDIKWSDNSPSLHDYECYRATAPPRWDHPELSCLGLATRPGGCSSIMSQGECLSSRDGRELLKWNGLRIRGEPCVWCGGGPCTDRNSNVCETRDYLLHGQGRVYRSFLAQSHYTMANCTSLSDAPEMVPANGRFISGGESVFWISPFDARKHEVPPDLNCTACGCRDHVESIITSYVDSIAEGAPFSCNMIPGFEDPQGASGTATFERLRTASSIPPLPLSNDQLRNAAASSGHHGGLPWWSVILLIALLCAVGGSCAVIALRRPPRKKKRKASALGMPDGASDEERSRLMEDQQEALEREPPRRLPAAVPPALSQLLPPFPPLPQLAQPSPVQTGGAIPGARPLGPWPAPLPGPAPLGLAPAAYSVPDGGQKGALDARDWHAPVGMAQPIQFAWGNDPRHIAPGSWI